MALTITGTIAGTVRDPSSIPVGEIQIRARNWSGNGNGKRTDSSSLPVDGMGLNPLDIAGTAS